MNRMTRVLKAKEILKNEEEKFLDRNQLYGLGKGIWQGEDAQESTSTDYGREDGKSEYDLY